DQPCATRGRGGLLSEHVSLFCLGSTHRDRFLLWTEVGLSRIALGATSMGQASSSALSKFHSPTGNPRAAIEKTARNRERIFPWPNPRLAAAALPGRSLPDAQTLDTVDDQHTHAGVVSSAFYRAAGLLLLV